MASFTSEQPLDIFDIIRDRFDDSEKRTLLVLDRVNQVYVECGRDALLDDVFSRLVANAVTKQLNGRRGKGQVLFVTGESGAGKTRIVERLLANHKLTEPIPTATGIIKPSISVSQQGPTTLATLGNKILRAAGYPARRELSQSKVWALLPDELARRQVIFVHIDEVQHVLRNPQDWGILADALKGMMNSVEWPVSFILTGLPMINALLSDDAQTERRSYSVQLPGVSPATERVLIENIIAQLCKAAEMESSDLVKTDLPERLAHAANYQYGRISETVVHAIQIALQEGASALHQSHFASAYLDRSHARGRDHMNPFLVADWESLEPGFYFVKEHPER